MPLAPNAPRSPYLRLYHNARRQSWDPTAIDLTRDREQWATILRDHAEERYGEQIHRLCSLFYEGEESVTKTLSPFLSAVSRARLGIDKELCLVAQLADEARHFEFFGRYFTEVFGDDGESTWRHMTAAPQAVLVDDLENVASRMRREENPQRLRELLVEGVTHYMGVVEAMLARTGYYGAGEALATRGWLPGLREGFEYIRRDEGRHVAFGVHFLVEMRQADPEATDIVLQTFERHLPNVIDTVRGFDVPHPLVDVARMQQYAIDAYTQFMAAAGIADHEDPERAARELTDQ
jgi:ribonucleoside-diphosphate reductase beta chain